MKTMQIKILGSSLLLALSLAACGGESTREVAPDSPVDNSDDGTTGGAGGGSTGGGGGGGSSGGSGGSGGTLPPPTGGGGGNLPPLSFSFEITGPGGKKPTYRTPKINTDSILRVRVIAGPAGQLSKADIQFKDVKYSNFMANYNCVAYTVRALGQTITTKMLSAGGAFSSNRMCPGAPSEDTLEFSNRLTPGHAKVQVEVTSAYYDFYCNLWANGWAWGNYQMYCPLHTVYRNHTLTGSLQVQVNGTSF